MNITNTFGLPDISIVLPVYNGQRYLAESIQSCIDQTHQNWELIVIDDASNDATPDIAKSYAAMDSRIIYFRNEVNLKLPGSINRGMRLARGTWVSWTSDDNRYLPEALAVMMEQAKSGSADFYFCDYQFIDSDGHLRSQKVVGPVSALWANNNIGCCFLYKRSIHEQLGYYDDTMYLCEDYEFWLRVSTRYRMEPIHRVLYHYRLHDRSLTATNDEDSIFHLGDKALEKNMINMKWMSPRNLVEATYRIAAGYLKKREWRVGALWILKGFYVSPIEASNVFFRKTKRLLSRSGTAGK
jgi:glycosyltransferase involved in cell wall biosynthesis